MTKSTLLAYHYLAIHNLQAIQKLRPNDGEDVPRQLPQAHHQASSPFWPPSALHHTLSKQPLWSRSLLHHLFCVLPSFRKEVPTHTAALANSSESPAHHRLQPSHHRRYPHLLPTGTNDAAVWRTGLKKALTGSGGESTSTLFTDPPCAFLVPQMAMVRPHLLRPHPR